MPWNGQHNCFHTWVTLNDAIIDVSIKQQYPFFDFKGKPFVFGEIPKGLIYMGWEESTETINRYTSEITEFSKMTLTDWLKHHLCNLTLVCHDLEKELGVTFEHRELF